MGDVETDVLDDAEAGLEEGGQEGAEDTGQSGDDTPDEPFLTIDDRTVYKTKEAAVKGVQDTKDYLAKYQKYGKPEDLEKALEENRRLKAALVGDDLSEKDKDKLAELIEDPKLLQQWRDSKSIVHTIGEEKFVSREEFEKVLNERDEERFRARTHSAFDEMFDPESGAFKDSGIKVDRVQIVRMEAVALAAIQNRDKDPLGEKLANAYNAGDADKFARELVKGFYGDEALKSKRTEQPRDKDGKFKSAAEKQRAAEKASGLPKAPPEGGAPPGGGGSDDKLPDIKGGGRRNLVKDWFKARRESA